MGTRGNTKRRHTLHPGSKRGTGESAELPGNPDKYAWIRNQKSCTTAKSQKAHLTQTTPYHSLKLHPACRHIPARHTSTGSTHQTTAHGPRNGTPRLNGRELPAKLRESQAVATRVKNFSCARRARSVCRPSGQRTGRSDNGRSCEVAVGGGAPRSRYWGPGKPVENTLLC